MATEEAQGFRPLDEASLVAYIKAAPGLAAYLSCRPDALTIKEVSDGNLNFVYIVLSDAGSLIVKQIHPVLMLIGYIILGSEAIMVYNVLPTWNHDTTKLIHLILHAIALVLCAVGMYCAFKYYNESGIANLYSLHSWLGIRTICLYGIQWIFGFVAFFFPGAAPNVRRGALPWHILFVLFVYILALATSELGFLEKLTFLQSSGLDKYGAEAFLVNFTALVVVIFGASVVVADVAPACLEEPQGYAPIPENYYV